MSVKGILEISETSPKKDEKGEFTKLLGDIVASIHKRNQCGWFKSGRLKSSHFEFGHFKFDQTRKETLERSFPPVPV
jgi:hypothetical protein